MKMIVVTNFKGGTGKTVITVLLAELCMVAKKSVLVLDTDKQYNAVDYLTQGDGSPVFQNVTVIPSADKEPDAATLEQYDVVIVDTPPASVSNKTILRYIARADLVIIPLLLQRHALTAAQLLLQIIPDTRRVLTVLSTSAPLRKSEVELLNAVRASFSPLAEIPHYGRVETNLANRRVFWNRLTEAEYSRFEAFYSQVAGLLF